jgi:hypothetical protein
MKTVPIVPTVQSLRSVQAVTPRKKSPTPSFVKSIFFRPELEIALSHDWPGSSLILYTLSFQDGFFPWKAFRRRIGFER